MADGADGFGRGGIGVGNGSSRRETGEAGRMPGDGFRHLIVIAPDEIGDGAGTARAGGVTVGSGNWCEDLTVIVK